MVLCYTIKIRYFGFPCILLAYLDDFGTLINALHILFDFNQFIFVELHVAHLYVCRR